MPPRRLGVRLLCCQFQTPKFRSLASLASRPGPASTFVPTQPPSFRAAPARKTQLHRTYLSLLRSVPLLLLFQHNNLLASEWSALRRELSSALAKISPAEFDPVAEATKITVVQSRIFGSALRVAEHYDKLPTSKHGSSAEAYQKTRGKKNNELTPLLSGPLAVVSIPAVSPVHLKAVCETMFPEGRGKKGLDPAAAAGAQKLILLAARVDGHLASGMVEVGRVFDQMGVKYVSGLPGLDGLRGTLVASLQSVGGGNVIRTLESAGIMLVRTVEGREKMLEDPTREIVENVNV